MTANQIANASNRIQQEMVDENERHNQSVENETTRHNSMMEELQQQSNRLQQDRDYWDAWYKQESIALQKEYNTKYLEWQKAQGEEKLRIEQELANIEQQKANADERYKWEATRINKWAQDLEQQRITIDKEYKDNMLSIEGRKLDYQNTLNLLEAKRIEYQNSYWNASILNAQQGLLIQHEHNLNDYNAKLMSITNDTNRLTLQAKQLELDMLRFQTETKFKAGQLGVDIFNTAANFALKAWGFGMMSGPAESLFK